MKFSQAQLELLVHLAKGGTLKSHRTIDGDKVYRLHLLDGTTLLPLPQIINGLKRHRYIDSNKKFPAATYLLTNKGHQAASEILNEEVLALTGRNYGLVAESPAQAQT